MTKAQKAACKAMAADVRASLAKHGNTGISVYNYGLHVTGEVRDALLALLPGIAISSEPSFLGYLHFTDPHFRKEQASK